MQWNNPCKSRRPCTGARDAAEAPTNWRNPLEHLVKVLVPLSAKAGGAGAAGSSSVSVGGINQRTAPGGSRDWEKSEGREHCPQLLPLLSRAGCAGTTPVILISKRREIPQRDELLLVHPKEHLQKWKPLHLCLAWVSQQELGQGGIWDRTRGLESCPKNRSQKLPSQSSTCSTKFEGWESSSLKFPFQLLPK